MRVHHASVSLDVGDSQVGRWHVSVLDGLAQGVPGVKGLIEVDADYATHVRIKADVPLIEQEKFAAPSEELLLAVAGTQAALGAPCAGDEEAQHRMEGRAEAVLNEGRDPLTVHVTPRPAVALKQTLMTFGAARPGARDLPLYRSAQEGGERREARLCSCRTGPASTLL